MLNEWRFLFFEWRENYPSVWKKMTFIVQEETYGIRFLAMLTKIFKWSSLSKQIGTRRKLYLSSWGYTRAMFLPGVKNNNNLKVHNLIKPVHWTYSKPKGIFSCFLRLRMATKKLTGRSNTVSFGTYVVSPKINFFN